MPYPPRVASRPQARARRVGNAKPLTPSHLGEYTLGVSLHIQSDRLRLEINPEVGASPAAFEAKITGQWVPIMRPTPRPLPDKSSNYSSFTLAPYSNRIRAARFIFEKEYQLEPNTPQGNAQHGDVRNRPWKVAQFDPNILTCSLDSRDFPDFNWPWTVQMRKTYRVEDNHLDTLLELTNASGRPMPAGLGLHPYFVRDLLGAGDVLMQFQARGYYQTDETLIPSSGMTPLPPDLDFSSPRKLGGQKIDTVFGGWDGKASLEWLETGVRMTIQADPVFEHLVVFTAPDGTLALEPVTNATDGFNLMARGIQGTGVVVLEPGESLRGSVRINLEGI